MRPRVSLSALATLTLTLGLSSSAVPQFRSTRYSSGNGYSYSYSGSWSSSWNSGGRPVHNVQTVQSLRPVQTVQSLRPVQTVQTFETVEPLRSTDDQLTSLEFLSPSGVRISVAGPYPQSTSYQLKFHLNLNHAFNGARSGDHNQELTLGPGSAWSHTFPNIRPRGGETIYYLVEVKGQQGNSWWSRDYTGYYQLPQPFTTQGSWTVQIPSGSSGSVRPNAIPPVVQSKPRPPEVIYTPQYKPTEVVQQRPRPSEPVYNPQPKPVVVQQPSQTDYKPKPSLAVNNQPSSRPPVNNQPPSRPPVNNQPPPRPTVVHQPQFLPPTSNSQNNVGNIPPRQGESNCQLSLTTFNNGKRACAGKPVVSKFEFNSVEQIAGYEPEEKFTVFSHENVLTNNLSDYFVKTIFPSLLEEKYGKGYVDKTLTLPRCTSRDSSLCSATGMGYFILPPILSGRETSSGTLSFCYGVLEVTARLPPGDWVVPELWLLPKNRKYGTSSGKIVMALSRGNRQLSDGVQDFSSRVLEAGVVTSAGSQMFRTEQSRPWADDYHKFKLVWTPDRMEFYADDRKFGEIQPIEKLDPSIGGTKMAPFDQEFYVVFGVHVGGDADFPDSLTGKPWVNSVPKNKVNFWRERQQWHTTWNDNTALHIAGISLTALG